VNAHGIVYLEALEKEQQLQDNDFFFIALMRENVPFNSYGQLAFIFVMNNNISRL
jgi:hypothetical protein